MPKQATDPKPPLTLRDVQVMGGKSKSERQTAARRQNMLKARIEGARKLLASMGELKGDTPG